MGRYILKLNQWYFEWSTIVDAPITWRMTLEQFKQYYQQEYGDHGMENLPERLERVEKSGTSAIPTKTADELISFNRAGEKEENLSRELILEKYTFPEEQNNE